METQQLETILATVHALLQAEGMGDAAHIVRPFPARAEQIGYDNWNETWPSFFTALKRMAGARMPFASALNTCSSCFPNVVRRRKVARLGSAM